MPKNINALKNKDILMNSFRKGQFLMNSSHIAEVHSAMRIFESA
jgi:hypothetical protein